MLVSSDLTRTIEALDKSNRPRSYLFFEESLFPFGRLKSKNVSNNPIRYRRSISSWAVRLYLSFSLLLLVTFL
jgi:hypothetical protein